MLRLRLVSAVILGIGVAGAQPSFAQGAPTGGAGKAAEQPAAEKASRGTRAARSRREPTAGQMAARERQRKCGAEWKEAKAANRTGGTKWPQFWSRCNARLKGNQA
jgi:hypothetical protein